MKKIKRIFAALLALAMLLGLAACGQNKSEADAPEGTPAPEYVYVAEYTTIQDGEGQNLRPIAFTDNGFYASSSVKVGEKEIPEGETPAYEGQYDIYEDRFHFVSFDGTVTTLEKFTTAEAAENTEDYQDFNSGSSIYTILEVEDGSLLALEYAYAYYYDGPKDLSPDSVEYWDHYVNDSCYYIRHLNADGTEISSARLDPGEDVYINGNNAILDEKGNLVFSYNDSMGNWGLTAVTLEGETVYKTQVDNYIDSLIRLKDGRIASSGWGMEGMELKAIDASTGKFTDTYAIPNDAYNMIPGNSEYDFYYTSGIKLYGYNIETGEKTQILDWISCDVNGNNINQVHVTQDGIISGIVYNWQRTGMSSREASTTDLVVLRKIPYESVPQKEHLTLAVMYMDYNLQSSVIDFNRRNDQYRIDVVDYSEYNTEDDYSAGRTKLITEVSAGKLPDILWLSGLPYTQLASKGLLEDLYPYLDADKELNRSDFFENVLQAMEVNGGLYQVASNFEISTVIGARSVVGDRTGWTYRDVLEALKSMPEGCEIFGWGTTKDYILQASVALDMDNLIDWANGKCSFDSPEFLDMLEFANQFALEADYDNYDYEVDSDRARVSKGQQMLMNVYLYDFTDFQEHDYYFGGEGQAAYIGFPTSDGSSGNALMLGTGYAMSSACPYKEAAWEFLRSFLNSVYDMWGMPINRGLFDEMKAEAMKADYMTDADGNFVLDENGEKMEISHMAIGFGDGTTLEIGAMTQEQADLLETLIESTTKTVEQDDQVTQLVLEEAQAYFNGQKSAEEVAKLIQSKVNIYVNEQR